jgi:hypothetical protein
MVKRFLISIFLVIVVFFLNNCGNRVKKTETKDTTKTVNMTEMQKKVAEYVKVKITSDLKSLTDKEKKLLPLLFDAAQLMDDIYWEETLGNKDEFLASIKDEDTKKFALINYGPWDRLDGNKPFISSFGEKPKGANFYPKDMTKEEFEKMKVKEKNSEYTILRRDEKGALKVIPYHIAFKEKIEKASSLLKQVSEIADDPGMKKYLKLRAEALITDKYYDSDIAWMDMRKSNIDFVIGPIENYEDALNGIKAAHESFILIKDNEWSAKLAKYTAMLPKLQKELPVEAKYKKEMPGTDSDINAYDVIYYAGDCNSGGKTIAINLPNDEKIQLKKGTRKLQLKNSMKAKFDNILVPISNLVITENQRKYIKFGAFFENTMFHEVAHGMGIKNTINGKGTVRYALKETYSSVEEGKADILGLYIVTKLYEMCELNDGDVMDNYVTFLAGIIRSVRFGASEAHGKANMKTFNFLQDNAAFARNYDGTYVIDFDAMKVAVIKLVKDIISIQGDGNYDQAKKDIEQYGVIREQLQKDLDRIKAAKIPVDIIFDQGKSVIGL